MLGKFCRDYRVSKGATLKDIEGGEDVKTLSAFEMGRSSNIAHFAKYLTYSISIGDGENFLSTLHKEGQKW